MGCWIGLMAYQTVSNFFLSCKKIISNSLLTVWYALRPKQQPTVSPNYSQSIKLNIGPSDSETIIPWTHHLSILYWRLSDFKAIIRTCPLFGEDWSTRLFCNYLLSGCHWWEIFLKSVHSSAVALTKKWKISKTSKILVCLFNLNSF